MDVPQPNTPIIQQPPQRPSYIPVLIFSVVFLIIGLAVGNIFSLKNTTPVVTPSTTIVQTPSPVVTQTIDPDSIDINTIKNPNMNLNQKLYLDFYGDGQKEIVLIGTDKQHIMGAQAGPSIEMPLIDVFKYSPIQKNWLLDAELNSTNLPTVGNGSTLNKIIIVSLGKKEALVTTSVMSGSRVNERFEALVATGSGVKPYGFPESVYTAQGGQVPHEIDISVGGQIIVNEGLYKPTDSNNDPTNGSLKVTFQLNDSGFHLVKSEKLPYNLTIQ